MRLLQMCTTFNAGGIQRHVMDVSAWLRSKGYDVFLAGESGFWLDETTAFDYLPLNLLKVSTHLDADQGLWSRIWWALKCARQLRAYLKKNNIELIHAHESSPAIVAGLATFGLNIPVIVTYHGSDPGRLKPFGWVCRAVANKVITPSYRCAEELHQQAGVRKEIIDVIGLGIEPPPVLAEERIREHRRQLLGENGKYLVVIIARLDYQKGIDILVDVVRSVKSQRDDIRFVVVGDGVLRDEVREWAKTAGVEDCLRFDGVSDEPYLYLKAGDMFLLTSRWEALPITIAEAFQAKLPVVATDTGGVKELVSADVGFVHAIGDVDALSKSVLDICGDEGLRSRMSDAAARISQGDRFSVPHIHNIFEKTYLGMLKR